jgi:sigma-B regulation protein RsbU (phosphoserine phosphatase)
MFLRVIRGEVQQRERLESEVRIARDIQQSLLPSSTLTTPSCTASGITLPATEVGGDYYDAVVLPDGKIALAIADVAGHGVGAGILSAMTKSAFHSQLLHDPSAAGVLANLNSTIFAITDEKMFVTFAYVLIDPQTHTGQVATAGHPPVLIRRAASGKVEQFRSATLGMGIREVTPFTSETVPISSGDLFLLYTDGVTEAMNANGEQFGMERLVEALASSSQEPEELCRTITRKLASFTGEAAREDDVSLLCAIIR